MPTIKKWILFGSALCFIAVSQAQTLEEVISRHLDAMGGKEKLKSVSSLYMETVSVMQNGNEVTGKVWKVQDKLLRREINFGMGSFTMVLTDKAGWSSNPRTGGKFEPLTEEQVKMQQWELDCNGPLVNYAEKGHKAELLGKEEIAGTPCHVVKLTLNNGREMTYFIDASTHYVLRLKTKGGRMGMGGGRPGGGNPDGEVVTEFSDYRKTEDGYVFPFTTTIVGMGASTSVEKVEVNKPVDAALYKAG